MSDLGKYRANAHAVTANLWTNNLKPFAFHRVDIAGVASSILATPTILLLPPAHPADAMRKERIQFGARPRMFYSAADPI